MERLISCEFNMDTACVELKFVDGSMISIDTIAVENEVADNMYQRSELDWLIYNKPLEYAQLVLDGNLERYVKGTPERKTLWLVQTPQVFNIQLIKEAYRKLIDEKIENATDDAMVVEQMMGHNVKLYPGAYENIKITTPEDLLVAEAFL